MKLKSYSMTLILSACLQTIASAGPIDSPGGSKFLYLSTGPGDRGVSVGDISGNGDSDFDLTSYTFSFLTDGTNSFMADVNILTSESADEDPVPDFWGVKVNGSPVGAFTPLGFTVSLYSLLVTNGAHTAVIPPEAFTGPPILGPEEFYGLGFTSPPSSLFLSGQTGWLSFIIPLEALPEGEYTIEVFLADDDDPVIDTALLIDNVRLDDGFIATMIDDFETDTPGTVPALGTISGNGFVAEDSSIGMAPHPEVPEPSSIALALIALAGGLGYSRRRKLG